MVLNLFCAVAHFEESQILFWLSFLPWSTLRGCRFSWPTLITSEMMTKLLELSSERISVEVISKKKGHFFSSAENGQSAVGIGVDLQSKTRSLRLPFMGAVPYGGSYAPLLLNLIRLANPLLKYANVCGPSVENQRLRPSHLCD